MDLLYEIVNGFDASEEKLLSKYLSYKTSSGKILQLFELLRKEEKLSREQIISKIYGKGKETDKAVVHAYYQLRLRLNEKIENFILEQVHKEDTGTFIKNLVSIAGLFFRRNLFQLAWHYVKKAEELAVNSDKYGELNLLYALQIEYHWTPYAPDIEELVNKINKNLVLVKKEYDLNSAVALIKHRISEARQGDITDVENSVQDILKAYPIDKKVMNTASFKFKVASIVGYTLYEKKDFKTMEKYLLKIYTEMEQAHMFDQHNYMHKLNLLGNIGFSALKLRKYSSSEKFIHMFRDEQLKHNISPNVYWTAISSHIYICTGRYQQAKDILQQLLKEHESKLYPEELTGIYMNLTTVYVIETNYSMAAKCLFIMQQHEKTLTKQYSTEGAFKKDIIECMIHFDMKDHEFSIYRLYSIGRKFKDYLADPAHLRDKTFVGLFRRINKNPDLHTNPKYIAEADQFIAMKPIEPDDSEFVSFNAWLKAKVENRKYYEVFLEMVR